MVPKIDRPSDKSMLKNPQDKTIWLLWILLYNELIYLGGKLFELVLTECQSLPAGMWCRHRSSSNISPHISSNFDLHQPYFRRSKLRLSWAGRKKHSTPQYLWKHKSSPASWRSKLLSHNKLWKFPGSKPEWKLQSSAKKSRFFLRFQFRFEKIIFLPLLQKLN